ncbi:MAG: VOC family protein [Ilumatobacteraceae bacterium]|nr:VOC family protein [Ilumatobacteraceae bacterium]
MSRPRLRIAGTVLSTRDPRGLAAFYERLLGWPRLMDEDGWVVLRDDPAGQALSFHGDDEYVPPTWPSVAGEQLMMLHLDIATDDLDAAVAHAIECGATRAAFQPQDDEVTVMLDPDGHPFCLFPSPNW